MGRLDELTGEGDGLLTERIMRALTDTRIFTGQTATDARATTETEVRIAYRNGVNSDSTSSRLHDDIKTTVQALRSHFERNTMDLVDITKVETRTVTTICTPWIEA